MGSSAATGGENKVHLAGPLARADGGVARPAAASALVTPPAPVLAAAEGGAGAGLCQDSAPSGASAAVLAYIAASNAVVPQWTAVSHAIGDKDGKARPQDFLSEMNADSRLLGRLDEIKFSGRAAILATEFETSLRKYLRQLQRIAQGGATPGATATLDRLYSRRATASSLLRAALGLSPDYACQWLRPGTGIG